MEIQRLRYFRAVVEAGGLKKAAELLHITPGALSKAIRQLEDDTGKTLFNRVGRGLELTEHGRKLYAASERVIEEHRRMLENLDASTPATETTLSVASYEVFTTYCLGATVMTGLEDAALRILEMGVGDLERAVIEREADAAITYAPFPEEALSFHQLAVIEFGIFARHDVFRETPVTELPFAIPTARIHYTLVDMLGIDSWPYQQHARRVKYRLTSLESALELCRRGCCAVFLPDFVAGLHNQSVKRALRLTRRANPQGMRKVRQAVQLVTRTGDRDRPILDALSYAVQTAIEEGASARLED